MPTLIKPKQALEILQFCSRAGLYAGAFGTNRLTRVPAGRQRLFIKEECEAFVDEILANAEKQKIKNIDRIRWNNRKIPTELV